MSYFDRYFEDEEMTTEAPVQSQEREEKDNMINNIKLTIDGKMAVKSKDGFYYSVNANGTMKREYSVFEPISEEIITRERSSLKVGDILILNDELYFCSGDQAQYTLTNFMTKQIQMIQKGQENDELGETYTVIINPLASIVESDPDVDPALILANNPQNAEKINLTLQIDQSKSLGKIVSALIDKLE